MIKQFLKMEAQQSRRIDIVNEKTLLLTSLNQGSSILFSN
jgi:transmembrane regulatory protein ToxS